jgi:hypothetical protein
MALLIDLGDVPDECCTDTLEELAKATSFGQVSHLWDRSPNRFVVDHIEAVSARLNDIMDQMRLMLTGFLSGHGDALMKADVPWLRWSEAHFEIVRSRLTSMSPDSMTLADYELLVDFIIQRYLSESVILSEAEYLAVRAAFLGKIQANLEADRRVTDPMLGRIIELLPTIFAHVPPHVFTPTEAAMMDYGRAHAAEAIRGVAEATRHRFAGLVLQHAQAMIIGQKEGNWRYLATKLFDEMSTTNRDMRRIAVTETGEIQNQGYIAAKATGQRVRRLEAYRGACAWCQSISGREFDVVPANAANKDGDTQIWVGKNNIGRSASRMKRQGDKLVERSPEELWWPAAGLQHPNCRGSWVPVTQRPPEVSEQFFAWMQATLDRAGAT